MPDLSARLGGRPALTATMLNYDAIVATVNGASFFLSTGVRFVSFFSVVTAGAGFFGDALRPKIQFRLSPSETWFDVASFTQYDAAALPAFPDRQAWQADAGQRTVFVLLTNATLTVTSGSGTSKFNFIGPALPELRARAEIVSGGTWSGSITAFLSVDTERYRYGRGRQWRRDP